MKKAFIFMVASTLIIHCQAQGSADKNRVDAAISAFMKSWNNHNFKDMSKYATKGFYYISPDAEVWETRDSVQMQLQVRHQEGFKNTQLEEKSREIRFLTKDVAMATVTAHLGVYYNGQKPAGDYWQLRTMTFVKQKGQWLLAAAQATAFPPVKKPTE